MLFLNRVPALIGIVKEMLVDIHISQAQPYLLIKSSVA